MTDNFKVPTWEDGQWGYTTFDTREDFKYYILKRFKEPGQYNFDEVSYLFNEQGTIWNKTGKYCSYPDWSKDFKDYWDAEKEKCRNGVIFKSKNDEWYLPREYYMWINFLPIYDKKLKKIKFPDVWDSQYHMALYELLAELHYKHVGIVKKRQWGSSYYHTAKMINLLWYEEGAIIKFGASKESYINAKGSWKYLNEYRSFLNKETAWFRPFNPGGVLLWQQQIEDTDDEGRSSLRGLKGVLQGITFDKDPTAGVGGPCSLFVMEEAGVAPNMDVTVEYLFPAMELGDEVTGLFVAAGSVGDLDDCGPLKEMIYNPVINSIYPVKTNLLNEDRVEAETGLFIPEFWSMPPYIDKYGNSLVEEAFNALTEKYAIWKTLPPEKCRLRISQQPRFISEAFDYRKESIFPLHLVKAQLRRIDEKEYPYETIDLKRNEEDKVIAQKTTKLPITVFPYPMTAEDKTGAIVVWERPSSDKPEWGEYYASIDPVAEGKTLTSKSLCSIYVYKTPLEKTTIKNGITSTYIEEGRVVAAWCGRFDDINDTNQRLLNIIEWYNAWTVVEANVSGFIQYVMNQRKQKYLVPKTQMIFFKELTSSSNTFQEYGWKNTGSVFKNHLLNYLVEYLSEVTSVELGHDGEVKKKHYGIERIPDIMAMKEMVAYEDGKNVDRIVALTALIAFAKVQENNLGLKKQIENQDLNKLQNQEKFSKLYSRNGLSKNWNPPRNAFKNLR